jgi:hypothetical protein
MDSGRRSGNFRGVKITLIVFQSIAIIGAIAITIMSIICIILANSYPPEQASYFSSVQMKHIFIRIVFKKFFITIWQIIAFLKLVFNPYQSLVESFF